MVSVLLRVVYTVVVIALAWFFKKQVTDRMIDAIARKQDVQTGVAKPVKNFSGVIIYVIAFFILLGIWNLRTTLTGLLAAAGMVGIVIGLSLREVISDLLAGVILFFDTSFRVGDALVVGDLGGKVLDIGIRSVKLKTWDGVFATIPNRKVASEVLKNYSKYTERRLEVVVGVDYDSDLEKVRQATERVLARKDLPILKEPPPIVALDTLDASSINFKILFWFSTDIQMPWINLRGKLMEAIIEEFRKEKISIPFPQVTISSREPEIPKSTRTTRTKKKDTASGVP